MSQLISVINVKAPASEVIIQDLGIILPIGAAIVFVDDIVDFELALESFNNGDIKALTTAGDITSNQATVPSPPGSILTELQSINSKVADSNTLHTTTHTKLDTIDTSLVDNATGANQLINHTKLDAINTSVQAIPGGGDATAANQVLEIAELTSIKGNGVSSNASLVSIDGKLTGVATEAKQDAGNTSLGSIDTKLTDNATATLQGTGNSSLSSIDTKVTGLGTAANQVAAQASLTSIDGKLADNATATLQAAGNAALASIDTKVTGLSTSANQVAAQASLTSIDGKLTGAATEAKQDVEITALGTIDTSVGTSNVSLASIDGKMTTLNAKDFATEVTLNAVKTNTANKQANMYDGGGTALTSTAVAADRALDVNVVQSVGAMPSAVNINDGVGNNLTSKLEGGGVQSLDVNVRSQLGMSTEAKQDSAILKITDVETAQNVGNVTTAAILSELSDHSTNTLQSVGNASLNNIDTDTSTMNGTLSTISTKVDAQATAVLQTAGNGSLSSLDGKLTTSNSDLALVKAAINQINVNVSDIETAITSPTGTNPTLDSIDTKIGTSNTALNSIDLGLGKTFDLDQAAGTENVLGVSLRTEGAAGSMPFGTATDPMVVTVTGGGSNATAANQVINHTKLDTVESTLNAIEAELADHSTSTLQATTNGLLTTIDADTGNTATSVASVDGKLTSTNALLTTIDADTGTVAIATASSDTKLTTTNATLATIDIDTGSIASSSTSIDGKMTTNNSSLASVDGKLTTIDTTLSGIKTDTGNIDTSLNNVEADIALIQSYQEPVIGTKQLHRYLDLNGNGTGSKDMQGVYTPVAPGIYYIEPGPAEVFVIDKLTILIRDNAILDMNTYGNNITLANGIIIRVMTGISTLMVDLTDGVAIHNNGDYLDHCDNWDVKSTGGGQQHLQVIWKFDKKIRLDGANNDRLEFVIQDNISNISEHRGKVQGYIE